MQPEQWGVVGTVITAIAAYLGVRYTSRQSREALRTAQEMESKAVDAAAYDRARASYESAISNYLREIDSLQTRVDSLAKRIVVLNAELLQVEEANLDQRTHLEEMVKTLEATRFEYEQHLEQCRDRVTRLRDRLRAGEELSPDDPDLQVPHW